MIIPEQLCSKVFGVVPIVPIIAKLPQSIQGDFFWLVLPKKLEYEFFKVLNWSSPEILLVIILISSKWDIAIFSDPGTGPPPHVFITY